MVQSTKGPVIFYGMYRVGKKVYKLFKKFMARSVEQKKNWDPSKHANFFVARRF